MKTHFTAKISLFCVAALFLGGCASLFDGGPSWLAIETTPANVKVKLYGIQNGESFTKTTPCRVELNKGTDYKLTFETPSYRSEEIIIRRNIKGWFWGNLLLVSVVGMGIDAFSNNMWEHNQHVVSVVLDRLSEMPDYIQINMPVVLKSDDGTERTEYLPVMFYKKG